MTTHDNDNVQSHDQEESEWRPMTMIMFNLMTKKKENDDPWQW